MPHPRPTPSAAADRDPAAWSDLILHPPVPADLRARLIQHAQERANACLLSRDSADSVADYQYFLGYQHGLEYLLDWLKTQPDVE